MANTQHIHMLLFFLVLTACLGKFADVQIETGLKIHAKQATKVEQCLKDRKDSPCVTQQKKVSPPMKPTQSDELRSSDVPTKDTIQRTTQGNSPGDSHSFPGKSPNMQPKVQDFQVTASKTDAFRYTTQAPRPDVGHSLGN